MAPMAQHEKVQNKMFSTETQLNINQQLKDTVVLQGDFLKFSKAINSL